MRLRDSTTGALLSEGWHRGRAALSSSAVTQRARDVTNETRAVAGNSRLAATARWTERAMRASWLYRWLTAEPDPDVVVIDLRETVVIGPILALLDRLLGPFVRNWNRARVNTGLTRLSDRFVARPVTVASVVVLGAVLTELLVLVGLGTPSPSAVGSRLLLVSVALAGTRVRASADELTDTSAHDPVVTLLSPPESPDGAERDGRSRE